MNVCSKKNMGSLATSQNSLLYCLMFDEIRFVCFLKKNAASGVISYPIKINVVAATRRREAAV